MSPRCGLSDDCEFKVDDPTEWLNHAAKVHEGESVVDCQRCGEATGYVREYAPTINFAGTERVVCESCQGELLEDFDADAETEVVSA